MSRSICVVGSIRMDLAVHADHLPVPGETVVGGDLRQVPGGRGATQAIAAARLGADVHMVGCVGDDAWGSELRAAFASNGVDATGVVTVPGSSTGAALVTVLPAGESAIVMAAGANAALTPELVDAQERAIAEADALLVQLEVPLESVERAIAIAAGSDTAVLLNAAPARELPPALLDRVNLLVVDEPQGRRLAGCDEDVEALGVARRLKTKVAGRVVVTLGRSGAVSFDGETKTRQEAFRVACEDRTAASDAFVAALAVALETQRVERALRFACAAGALASTRAGAVPSLPSRSDVDAFLGAEKGAGGGGAPVDSRA